MRTVWTATLKRKLKACVCLGLGNVLFLKDGERLGGPSNPDDDFADFESEEDGFESEEDEFDVDGFFDENAA